MASYKILGKVSEYVNTFANADTAVVPGIISSDTGQQLSIASATGAIKLTSDTEVQASKTLSTTGSGNINLPNNGSARFKIEGTSVGATVTAPTLDTLSNGSSADALHTHTSVSSASNLSVSGLTLFATPLAGEVGYISANNTAARARANVAGTSGAVGVYNSVSGALVVSGKVSILLEPSLTLSAGDKIYLSVSTAGRATNVEPSGSGETSLILGRLLDTTSYNGSVGSAQPCILNIQTPVLIP